MQANLCAFGSGSKPCRASLAPNSEHTLRLVWLPHYLRATPALCSALDASTAEPWHGSICLMSTSNSRAHKRKSFFLPYVSAWAGKTFLISTSVQLQYLVAFYSNRLQPPLLALTSNVRTIQCSRFARRRSWFAFYICWSCSGPRHRHITKHASQILRAHLSAVSAGGRPLAWP